jgi:hypothetical protein
MKTFRLVTCTIAVTMLASAPLQSAGMTEDQVAIKMAESMEKFYGKNISEVSSYLKREYGVSKPMKQAETQVTYMVPVSDPLCGSVALDTDGKTVVGLQTMAWDRKNDDYYGKACDKAFAQKR